MPTPDRHAKLQSSQESDINTKTDTAPPALIKTSYNQVRLKQIGLGFMILSIIGLGYVGYHFRDIFIKQKQTPKTQTSLPIIKETVNQAKLQQIKQSQGLMQGSSSAQASSTATPQPGSSQSQLIVPPASITDNYSEDQLRSLLDQQIEQLIQEKQPVSTLQDFKKRADSQPDQAKALLREAVQVAREQQALYLYYK